MRATLSIRGLLYWDPDIFEDMQIPEGMDANALKANILLEASELEVLIPDPSIMKDAINYWSTTRIEAWQAIYDALHLEYNPIWNKDGTITETTISEGSTSSTGSGSSLGKVAGMNEDTLHDSQSTTTGSTASGETSGEVNFTRRETGNIGVTTTQQMLKEELEIRKDADIYALITREFIDKFCLLVY